ncbi:MAG: NADH-quinone oxidoreductase subunit NuoG [Anaerolineales bacterium]|nr:NADH-quinone oxidoreductase subunit NuoG [Anaerolineales bacterium]
MSDNLVRLTIDGKEVKVPQGTLVVDAAKQAGISIPVFCYHPKMEPVGMCRMCLVEIGRPVMDRETRKPTLDESGKPVLRYGPKLETACTTPVGEGWDVRVNSPQALEGRNQIVEFLLTSHPLDCPVCDKGGECPLQNQTMAHGPGESRFVFSDKNHLAKHVSLGNLIFLDRERCIQCGRCVRFQDEIAGEAVIGFFHRGRKLEISTSSDPGFDSIFSGNTTDICPVGALTTADFRFGARPWELQKQASICTHCAVGCNLTLNTRREAQADGKIVIKRVMPRQNEEVNEIWICDKGRFGHHFAEAENRLREPLVRKNGKLVPATWDEALTAAARGLKAASGNVLGLAGGRAANEDLFCLREIVKGLGGNLAQHTIMAGGDLIAAYGLAPGSNLADLGTGDAILVLASDLYHDAPLWWLRVKQAAQRGATLIVSNGRSTSLDRWAAHILRFSFQKPLLGISALLAGLGIDAGKQPQLEGASEAANALKAADNVVVFYGAEGLTTVQSGAMAEGCARLIDTIGKTGKVNNGMVGVWQAANAQGAWDMGFGNPQDGLAQAVKKAGAVVVLAADPVGDQPSLAPLFEKSFVIVQELFETATTAAADVVLPALSFAERDGTFTSGERRVQRFYQALHAIDDARADWQILAGLAEKLEMDWKIRSAVDILQRIQESVAGYEGVDVQSLAAVVPQIPDVGGKDLYYGGNSYHNVEGTGVQLALQAAAGFSGGYKPPADNAAEGRLLLVPVNRIYDLGTTLRPSTLLESRIAAKQAAMHPEDMQRLKLNDNQEAVIEVDGSGERIPVFANSDLSRGAVMVPRSSGLAVLEPVWVDLRIG